MPRYTYRCNDCKAVSTIFHLSDETLSSPCPECGLEGSLTKLLNNFTTATNKLSGGRQKVGKITEEYIQDAREELKIQKKQLDDNR